MAVKKIHIKDLRLGMFVSELDISWVKSPFFRHKRLILKQEDIELLKKAGVESLVIDIAKSKFGFKGSAKALQESEAVIEPVEQDVCDESETQASKGDSTKRQEPKVPLAQEFKIAKRIQAEVINAVDQLQHDCEQGQGVSLELVNPIVEKTLQSIKNNSQAIMALLHEGRSDGKIATHSFGVFALILLLSNHLNFSVEDQQELGLVALTHDAGWTKLPSHLMSKGKSYTPQEKKLVRQHIPIVIQMLTGQPGITTNIILAIEQHREYLDGSGYPNQLKQDKIHLWAKLLAVCNAYDEMVHGLGEHPGQTPQNALTSLFQLAKKGKLEPSITSSLISLLGVYPLGSAVELVDRRLAVVVEINQKHPLKPVVQIFYDEAGIVCDQVMKVNLELEPVKIKRVLDIIGKDSAMDPKKLLVFTGKMLH